MLLSIDFVYWQPLIDPASQTVAEPDCGMVSPTPYLPEELSTAVIGY